MPSTSGARSIDAAGVVEACGPKQKSGAPNAPSAAAIAATSASSVGVVLGNSISVGVKPSASSRAIRSATERRSAVEIDQPDLAAGVAQHRGQQRQRVGRLGGAEDFLALLAASLARERDAVRRAAG